MVENRRIEVQTRRIAFWLLVLLLVFPGASQTAQNARQGIALAPDGILRPTIGFPTIQQIAKTFVITVRSKGSDNKDHWSVSIATSYGDQTIGLDVEDAHCWLSKLGFSGNVLPGGPFWDIEVKIRENTRPDLYDLTVQVGDETYTQKNAVQVIKEFSSTPTFVHITDLHIGFAGRPPRYEFVDTYGVFRRLTDEINLLRPDFVVITGDLVDWSNDIKWNSFYYLLTQFRVPVYTLVGNHDYYRENWWTPDTLTKTYQHSSVKSLDYYICNINSYRDYAFDYGPIRVVCLDSGYDVWSAPDKVKDVLTPKGSGVTPTQLTWLENVLRTGTRGNFVFMHHPVMRKAGFIDTTEDDGCIRERDGFIKLCKNTGSVGAVFSGHTHQEEFFMLENRNNTATDLRQSPSATLDGEYRYRWVKVTKPERGMYATEIRSASAPPNILGKWVYEDDIRLAEIVSLLFERDGTVLMNGPSGNIRIRATDCSSGEWEIAQDNTIDFTFTEQEGLKATGQIDGDRIREFKIGGPGEASTLMKGLDAKIVETTSQGKVWSEYVWEQGIMTARYEIRADKSFLATGSAIWRWKIIDGGLVRIYREVDNGDIIEHGTLAIEENKLVDKTCGTAYVRGEN